MPKTSVFLQLSPEFGGTKFGPFDGVEIRLGSDPTRNDIVLPEALGVSPEHVKVLRQQDESFIIAPTERTATIFLWRSGARTPKQVTTPTAVTAGDGFSVVTAEGPRFYILAEMARGANAPGADGLQSPAKKKKDADMAGGVMAEMKRIGMAKFFTSKVGNFFQTAWMMVKTGTIFSPRYIVMGMMMIVPMIFACGGLGLAGMFASSAAGKDETITDLRSTIDACGGGDEEPTVQSLTQSILGDRQWSDSLEQDEEFYKLYIEELKAVFKDQKSYKWLLSKKSAGEFDAYKKRLDKSMPTELSRVFAYTAAIPGKGKPLEREWGLIRANSDGVEACGRGPSQMTYRQAYHLELDTQPDALIDSALAARDDPEAKGAALKASMAEVMPEDEIPEFQLEEIDSEGGALQQGGFVCMTVADEDVRSDPGDLAKALGKALKEGAKGLPRDKDKAHWINARLVKFYAADFRYDYETLDFSEEPPSLVLANVKPDQKDFALRSAAKVLARSVAIPCMALLEKQEAEHLGEAPTLIQCGVLKLFVDYEL